MVSSAHGTNNLQHLSVHKDHVAQGGLHACTNDWRCFANNVIAYLNVSKDAIAIWSSALVWLCMLSALCALRPYLLPGMCDRHQR